ncbi:MAG: GHKL domain-containing protein [Butyrivibrio sp.]|nr:GHKL domain-containing protein [Butyrivibrio sp.]
MFEILEYILAAMKALCITSVMALGLEWKDKRLKIGFIRSISTVTLFTAVYMLFRIGIGIAAWLSNDILFIAGILIYGMICFDGRISQKLIFSAVTAFLASACMHGSNALFFLYKGHTVFLKDGVSALNNSALLAADINAQLVVIGIFVILWNMLYRRQKTVKYIGIYLIFPISQFVTVFFLNGEDAYAHLFGKPISIIGLLIGYVADVVLFYMLINHEEKKALKNRLEEMKRLREIEKAHGEAVVSGREEINKLSREFDARLTAIIDKVESGKKNEADILFHRLKTEVAATKECQYCSNAVVNAVLTEKENQARSKSVKTDINLTVDSEIEVSAMHLCSVFSNMLDNAINATAVYCGERFINVNSGYAGDYFFVNVENSCDRPIKKAARKGHGYGLKILEDIARQYDGQFVHGWQNDVYTSRIMLTVRSKER